MLNKQEIKRNFSQSAINYERHAHLQKKMAQQLFRSIRGKSCQKILDLGCGTGFLAYQLAKIFPQATVLGIDLAPGMIKVAKQRYQRQNLVYRLGDGERFTGNNYDLIVSNAALQWMDFQKVVIQVAKRLDPNGRFVFYTFGPKTLRELRQSGFRVNRFLPMTALKKLLGPKLIIKKAESETATIHFRTVREAFYHLKELGAQSRGGPRGTAIYQAFRNLRRAFKTSRGLPITFEVIKIVTTRR